ncbi:hypothetical protein YPPY02_4174, partial [Yersinia pestis PY-02]
MVITVTIIIQPGGIALFTGITNGFIFGFHGI